MENNAQEVKEFTVEQSEDGEVRIASQVIASIAGLAANEVEGVHSMAENFTNELLGRLSGKNAAKGVRVATEGEKVCVDMMLNMKYGYSIPKVTRLVQEKVKQQIENMTGLEVSGINVRVAGVMSN